LGKKLIVKYGVLRTLKYGVLRTLKYGFTQNIINFRQTTN